jgi:hypothetical protein
LTNANTNSSRVWTPITTELATANGYTSFAPVFYVYDAGSTKWNIEVVLGVMPSTNFQSAIRRSFWNATRNINWLLAVDMMGNSYTITIDGTGVDFLTPNGHHTDLWKTALGYNTAAFISLANNCSQRIESAVLQHRRGSSDPTN